MLESDNSRDEKEIEQAKRSGASWGGGGDSVGQSR